VRVAAQAAEVLAMAPARAPAAAAAPPLRCRPRARGDVARGSTAAAARAAQPRAALPAQQLRTCCTPMRAPAAQARAARGAARGSCSAARRALRCVAAAGASEDFYAVLGVTVTADGAWRAPLAPLAARLCALQRAAALGSLPLLRRKLLPRAPAQPRR
jgi:hypothetical protein